MLNVDREDAIKAIKSGENIFLTGNAGSGKTYLIKEFAKNSNKNVALTATTGIAALNLGGETFHRLLSIGITTRPELADSIIKKLHKFKNSKKPWEKAKWKLLNSLDTLIIDEASMLRRDQFELIEIVLGAVKENPKPFGGVQIVLVGDFFQLPPVVTPYDEKQFADLCEPFCFQSVLWKYGKFCSINLTTNYRQSDKKFLKTLDKIRIGKIDKDIDKTMESRINKKSSLNVQPIKLFSHKVDVKDENIQCIKKINEPKYLSKAEYTGKSYDVDIIKKDTPADDKLYFCKGSQIMMLTNEPKGKWVNGSMGIITGIDPVIIKLANGSVVSPEQFKWERIVYKVKNNKWTKETVASMKQYPFKLAYATTIHKSQGLTLDCVELDLASCFAPGQAYVALSRVKSIDGLNLKNWTRKTVIADPRVIKFYQKKESNDSG
jgi:ATP-dependent exoDNAse (exonuclease V) alpha subunit